jgi:hypothetical protein
MSSGKYPHEPFDTLTIRLSAEPKAMLEKRAREANESISGYIRRYLIEPWYVQQIGKCSTLTVFLQGKAEVIRVEVNNVSQESD